MTGAPHRPAWPPGGGITAALVRSADWGGTALGEAAGWPAGFRTAVEICLASPFPCFVSWGDDLPQIYNDAAIPLLRAQHPGAMGRPLREAWPGTWDALRPLAERVQRQGETVSHEDFAVPAGAGAPGGEERFTFSCSPLRDGAGRVAGVFATFIETARHVQVEDNPRQAEAHGAFLLEVADRVRPLADPQAILSAGAEALRRHLGLASAGFGAVDSPEGTDGRQGTPAHGAAPHDVPGISLDDPEETGATLSIPLRKGGAVVALFRARRPDTGTWAPHDRRLVREAAERIWEAAGCAGAEGAARQEQRRLRSLLEGIPQIVWRAVATGDWTWSSPQWTAYTGQSEEAARGRGWLAAVHPEDREGAVAAWHAAGAGGALLAEFRLLRGGDPEAGDHQAGEPASGDLRAVDLRYRWFQARATPVRDDAGTVLEWLGTCTDVDDLRRMGQHQRLLLAELQHRVRNTLSVIRSIIRRTVQASESLDELAMHLDGRIDAFSRVQAAVTRNPERGIDLAQLVADELRAHSAREGKQVRIKGVAVALRPKAAETMALAIHELATNAVKFGALSQPQGRVDVAWAVQPAGEAPRLLFAWQESGVPASPEAPERRGFGTDLFERTLPYELNADVAQDFTPGGLRCTIALPLSDRVVKAETLRELGIGVQPS